MINVGIIGYGYWGPNLVRSFVESADAKVSVVCDLDPKKRDAAGRRYPGIRTTDDYRELLKAKDVDAIAIATPVRAHFDLALAALQAGKHVLIEKPMTQTAEQGRRLIEEATRRNLVLMVDHTFIYTGAVRKIRDLVAAGELGEIYYYDSKRVNLGLFQHDVDVIWDLAVHDLSILEYVLGAHPIEVSANGASHFPGSPANIAYLTCFFDSGTIAHINANWLAPVKLRQTLIGGSRKMIVYDDLEPSEKIKIYDKGVTVTDNPEQIYQMMIGYRTGDMWAPNLDGTEALRTEIAHFNDCVANGLTPLSDGGMGLRVVEVLEAATRSMQERGRPTLIER